MLLKELMKEAGFSQYRLAVESGVPHATLWIYVNTLNTKS